MRETIPIEEAGGRFENEERGKFKDYTEKLVLFSTTEEETIASPVRTENRGKQRAKAEERNSSERLVLMTEMRDEKRRRDEYIREDLRWIDDNQAIENMKIEENLAAVL